LIILKVAMVNLAMGYDTSRLEEGLAGGVVFA
jgi:hypothetical protein